MKYTPSTESIPQSSRRAVNEKLLYLIDNNCCEAYGITKQDVFQGYTGDGGLHGLSRKNYRSYHTYSEAKKELENGQFFTPPALCQFVADCLCLEEDDLVADLTCGMGNFFNVMPVEANVYGCELDTKAFKVASYLYPEANLVNKDIRNYMPQVRFDYVVGNPPFNLQWMAENGKEYLSQLYYCLKAAQFLKPLGILALIVPNSFLADSFSDSSMIRKMEAQFRFLGQILLPDDTFAQMGVSHFPIKLQFWQKKGVDSETPARYRTGMDNDLSGGIYAGAAQAIHMSLLQMAKAMLKENRAKILRELAKERQTSASFTYTVEKMLYQIRIHPSLKDRYAQCCAYLHRFYTETQPPEMRYEEWCKRRLTEAKVLHYLRQTLRRQNRQSERDEIHLVKRDCSFAYKGYSAAVRRRMSEELRQPIPVCEAVLRGETLHGYERLLRKKRHEYLIQSQPFQEMTPDTGIGKWLDDFWLWDAENEEEILLNDTQLHDLNLALQKRYTLLQWEQGSGKTLAGIAYGKYRMDRQGYRNTWVISSAISIRNNWNVVLPNYDVSYVFVERLRDLERIKPGDFVLMTFNALCKYRRQIKKWLKIHSRKTCLVLDESDEICNPYSSRAKAVLSCFRRCQSKLLTTGTSTCRNCPERYYHAIPAPQKSKGLMMHFGESYCTLPKRARHLKSRDLNRRAPEWCPKRKVPNTLRIYYYRSSETYMLDNVLHQGFAFTPLPTASRYAMAYEGTSSLSPREFWLKLLTQKDTELLGIEVKAKSVVEIDDGLAPCFFFKTEEGYTRCQCFDADRARTNCMEGWEEYNQEDIK